jgi:hypothetical protein
VGKAVNIGEEDLDLCCKKRSSRGFGGTKTAFQREMEKGVAIMLSDSGDGCREVKGPVLGTVQRPTVY